MARVTTATGLAYEDRVEGSGDLAHGPGCFVKVHSTGWLEVSE
jgi:FKBP-type peptidyl-prolyl cis-trans isomerase